MPLAIVRLYAKTAFHVKNLLSPLLNGYETAVQNFVSANVLFGLLKPGYIETRLEKRMLSAKSKLLYGRNISKCMFLAVRGGETPCFEIKWVSIIQKVR